MLRLAIVLSLIGVPAMAKDGSYKAPKSPQIDSQEQFWQSEEGAYVEKLMERFQKGEITMDQARKDYNDKWGDKPVSGAQAVPNAPVGKF